MIQLLGHEVLGGVEFLGLLLVVLGLQDGLDDLLEPVKEDQLVPPRLGGVLESLQSFVPGLDNLAVGMADIDLHGFEEVGWTQLEQAADPE